MSLDLNICGKQILPAYTKQARQKWGTYMNPPTHISNITTILPQVLYLMADKMGVQGFNVTNCTIDYNNGYEVHFDFECSLCEQDRKALTNYLKYLNTKCKRGIFTTFKFISYRDNFAGAYLFELHFLADKVFWDKTTSIPAKFLQYEHSCMV